MTLWRCIHCNSKLTQDNNLVRCENNHSYDFHKKGHLHLLRSQKSKDRGDEKTMVAARTQFLNTLTYQAFLDHLISLVKEFSAESILDVGCGEGYYAQGVQAHCSSLYGFDISKDAIISASKRNISNLAVGSSFDMPVMDDSFDLAYAIFAPYSGEALLRVLKESGIFIFVYPLKNHLFELKELVYDHVLLNDDVEHSIPGFNLIRSDQVQFTKTLDKIQLRDLFYMTPYVHKTSKENISKLDMAVDTLVSFEFGFDIYMKETL